MLGLSMRRRRSPARWLAPLAVIACAVAVYSVVNPTLGADDASTSPATSTTSTTGKARTTAARSSKSRSQSRTKLYTVQTGDTLSSIAAENGLTLARIQQLNPALDSRVLQTGQRVKLSP
jgi:LysM repeat protein